MFKGRIGKLLSLMLALCLLLSLCSFSQAAAAPTNLVFYVMGDPPKDLQIVQDAINEKLIEKFNATVEFRFTTWTDYHPKYANELISGTVDMVYIAGWMRYGTYAKQGAFLELDALLDEFAPDLKAQAGEGLLNQCRIDGELYAFPLLWSEYTSNGISYREDLRKQFDLPVPDSIENFEAYIKGIQANMPEQGLLLPAPGDTDMGMQSGFRGSWVFNLKYPWVGIGGLSYGLASNYDTPADVYDYWYSEDFANDMKLMKQWADEGFWTKSILSDTNDFRHYEYGQSIAMVDGENPAKHIAHVRGFMDTYPDYETGFIAFGESTGVIYPAHGTQNGTAVLRSCKNPELAVQVLNYFMTDEAMNRLVQAGIEGTHYELKDGIYYNLSKENPMPFPYEGLNTWNLRVKEYKMIQETDIELNEIFNRLEAVGAKTKFPNVNIAQGFAEDYTDYEAERSAVQNVILQYLAPLEAGVVADVDAAIAEFLEKVEAAGLEACREGFTEQWLAYCEEFGYK